MKAVLHIGAPKTGSTSIEEFLNQNAQTLMARGILIPRSVGRASAVGLTLFAQSAWRMTSQRKSNGLADRRAFLDHRAGMAEALRREIAAAREAGPIERLVFSTETLWALLRYRREVGRLARLIQSVAEDVTVLVYLRRQDRFALSLYATQARFGRTRPFRFPGRFEAAQYDYAARLALWAEAFGREAIRVRPFEPDQLLDRDLMSDFAAEAELGSMPELRRPDPTNPAPSGAVIEFMRRMNAKIPRFLGDRPNPDRGPLGDLAEQVTLNAPRVAVSAAEARRFLARFEAGNRRVAQRYLGRADGVLFRDQRFADEAADGYAGELSADEAIAIAAQLWRLREATRQS